MGPLPPPVHGFSFINEKMLNLFESTSPVFVLKRQHITITVFFLFLARLISRQFSVGYIGLSGGKGQLVDCFFVVLMKVFRLPIYVHHHSFAYINHVSLLNRLVFRMLRDSHHIVLCDVMGDGLMARYGIVLSNVSVVSNACFLPSATSSHKNASAEVLRVGFLSNITEEKGIFDFLDIVSSVVSQGVKLEVLVAGPTASNIQERFYSRLSELPYVIYVGAVYDDDKRRFFDSIDVLIFPTKYVNEAEPVTILEAMSYGIFVIARIRGCIASMTSSVGLSYDDSQFMAMAESWFKQYASGECDFSSEKIKVIYNSFRLLSRRKLNVLFVEMVGKEVFVDET